MSYKAYATEFDYYQEYGGNKIDRKEIYMALRKASRHIDSLTFNRIVDRGFENLSSYQQDIIKEVVCRQADFETENADEIDSALSSYSLNGVSMQFGSSWNIYTDKGVAIKRSDYALLCQTGLCCQLMG